VPVAVTDAVAQPVAFGIAFIDTDRPAAQRSAVPDRGVPAGLHAAAPSVGLHLPAAHADADAYANALAFARRYAAPSHRDRRLH
jgi:hypothetical protein